PSMAAATVVPIAVRECIHVFLLPEQRPVALSRSLLWSTNELADPVEVHQQLKLMAVLPGVSFELLMIPIDVVRRTCRSLSGFLEALGLHHVDEKIAFCGAIQKRRLEDHRFVT